PHSTTRPAQVRHDPAAGSGPTRIGDNTYAIAGRPPGRTGANSATTSAAEGAPDTAEHDKPQYIAISSMRPVVVSVGTAELNRGTRYGLPSTTVLPMNFAGWAGSLVTDVANTRWRRPGHPIS